MAWRKGAAESGSPPPPGKEGSQPASSGTQPITPRKIEISDAIPYGQQPVDYTAAVTGDPLAPLAVRLASGEKVLDWKERGGYLESLLETFKIDRNSQLLCFSKTSAQPAAVTPENPRSMYFNDDIYVAWIPGTKVLEISAVDPVRGAIFYTLQQDRERPPQLVREGSCLTCHATSATLQVPGHLLRSFQTDRRGRPVSGYSHVTHETRFEKRFGGWYVTGTHGDSPHLGNLVGVEQNERQRREPLLAGNLLQLPQRVRRNHYQTESSDLVAHLVFTHQVHGHNLLTRVHQEELLGRRSDAEELLARYLIFLDEATLGGPIVGTSKFRERFEARGRETARQRDTKLANPRAAGEGGATRSGPRPEASPSLREFELKSRLFQHPLSFLVETRAYLELPDAARARVEGRIRTLLQTEKQTTTGRQFTEQVRLSVDRMLRDLRSTSTRPRVQWPAERQGRPVP